MSRFLECGVLLRIYTMFASILYGATGLLQTETIIYRVAHANDFATMATYGLVALSILGTVDVFINDLLPARFVLHPALRDRHLVCMAIALCFAVQMWTCVRYSLPASILPFYAVYVVLVPASAFSDVRKRYKNNQACP